MAGRTAQRSLMLTGAAPRRAPSQAASSFSRFCRRRRRRDMVSLAQTGGARMSIQGLHHITLVCADAQRTVDFYTQVLGLRLLKQNVHLLDPAGDYLFFRP